MTYNHNSRMVKIEDKLNNDDWQIVKRYYYDENDKLNREMYHCIESGGVYDLLQDVNYQYNIRGWLTDINNINTMEQDDDFFAMKIRYEDGLEPQNNGNISAIEWKSEKFTSIKTYNFLYDEINRLKTSIYTPNNSYNTDFQYDLNGNIIHISRNGLRKDFSVGLIDNMILKYNGNLLKNTTDENSSAEQLNVYSDKGALLPDDTEYFYDSNGNLIQDKNKKINQISYNSLNLPQKIEILSDEIKIINFYYNSEGIKLSKRTSEINYDFIDNVVYINNLIKYIKQVTGKLNLIEMVLIKDFMI